MAPKSLFLRMLLVLAAVGCLIGTAVADDQKANRTALVIGNEDYANAPSPSNAKADAQAVAELLTEAQFGVVRAFNATGDELRKKWKNFLPAIAPGDEAVLYFSGRGVRVGDDNYLLPVDVRADNEEEVKASGLSLKAMLDGMQEQKPSLFFVILDASRPSSARVQGLAPANPAFGQVVLYSSAPGKTSLERLGKDDPRTRGVFARVLLRELGRPGVLLTDMVRAVQEQVSAQAKSAGLEQVPAIFGVTAADFRFRPAGAPDIGQRIAEDEERQIWDKTDRLRSEPDYKRFLKAYPEGPLAAKAKDRIDDLASWELAKNGDLEPLKKYLAGHSDGLFSQKARTLLDEGDLWEKARSASDLALAKDYVNRYPQGRFLDPARALVSRLEGEAATKREDDAWSSAQQGGTPASFEQYLKVYPQGRYAVQAKDTIEQIVWDKAQKGNSAISFDQYLKAYPQGRYAASAKDAIEQIAWNEAQKANNEAAFEQYRRAYPQGRFATSATENIEQIAWDKAQKSNSETSFEQYLRSYPQGRYATSAREGIEQIVWDKAQRGNSEAAFDQYLRAYPQGRFVNSGKDKIEQLVWESAQRSRSIPLTQAYLQRYPQGKYAIQAKDQEEDILWDEARQCDVNDTTRDVFRCDGLVDVFIRRYGTGRYAAPAKTLQQSLLASRPEREEKKALADALATGETRHLQDFLDRFPKGKHYTSAMEKLAALWQKKAPLPITGTPFQDDFKDGSGKGPEMVALPGGRFIMGSDEALTEKPPHTAVIVHPYAIGKYEVTFDDWDACVAEKDKGGCSYSPKDEGGVLIFNVVGRGKLPVMNLTWDDTQQYLTWLSAKTGKKYRLLTEAEWEYAAKAGKNSRYSFGDNSDDLLKYGWHFSNAERRTHPVGQLAAAPNGLYDMHGNVAEWVQDCWHASYEGAPLNGNVGWTTNCVGTAHVARGGYFYDTSSNQRSASRTRVGNAMRSPTVGFRLARDYP